MEDNRYARQILAFGEEGQSKIEKSRVGIVGLGGTGSQVAQSLAYLGVKDFVIIDDDHVECTNLNRLVGAFLSDHAKKTLKTEVSERTIKQINPGAKVLSIPKNLRSPEAIEALISCQVIFGCVDLDGSRLILMELAAAYEAILIDLATEIIPPKGGEPLYYGGRVVVCRPGDFCLACAKEIDMEQAKWDLETPEIKDTRRKHGYGLGEGTAPSVISLNGIIASLAITEFLVMVTRVREPKRVLTYHGHRGIVNERTDARRDGCYYCEYLRGQREQANIFRYLFHTSAVIAS